MDETGMADMSKAGRIATFTCCLFGCSIAFAQPASTGNDQGGGGAPPPSLPMTFEFAGNGGNCEDCAWIAAQGSITAQTPPAFAAFAAEIDYTTTVVFNSSGGDLEAGMLLGSMIRERGFSTDVASTDPYEIFEIKNGGSCASACVYAYMGGVNRSMTEGSRLGVHQFFSLETIPTGQTQRLMGEILWHSMRMGIDPGVIVAAGRTGPREIYWFSAAELRDLTLVNVGDTTEQWRLVPQGTGLVLRTTYGSGDSRRVSVQLACRAGRDPLELTLEETNPWQAGQEGARQEFLGFASVQLWPDDDDEREITVPVIAADIAGDRFSLTLPVQQALLGDDVESLVILPSLSHAMWPLLTANLELPPPNWIDALRRNCLPS